MDEHHQDVPLADIPVHLQNAFIAIEDHRFYRHPGVDPIALGRAVVRNVRASGTVEGGSTLTQQLARTLFLSNKRSYGRKAREAVLAVMIDAHLSKNQVLELYLNRIYLSAGVYGVETMSRHLFGKPAKALTLAESALIAGLAQSPAGLSPWTNLDGAIERSHVVLSRMREQGFITAGQEETAAHARIRIRPYPGCGRCARRVREGVSCVSVSATSSAATIRPTGRCGRRSARSSRPSARGWWPTVSDGSASPICRRRSWRSIRRRATSSRSSAGATSGSRSSTAPRAAGASRAPPSSRLLFAAALEHGYSPVSVLEGLANVTPQGPEEWAPRNAERRRRQTR